MRKNAYKYSRSEPLRASIDVAEVHVLPVGLILDERGVELFEYGTVSVGDAACFGGILDSRSAILSVTAAIREA